MTDAAAPASRKRKASAAPANTASQRPPKHRKFLEARAIAAQTSNEAFKDGEIDVDKFVKAREFEIRALENGMRNVKAASSLRAFQTVPRDLRRRSASHHVKRIPKRLRARAVREMREDNTICKERKVSTRLRLRRTTAERLRRVYRKGKRKEKDDEDVTVTVTPRREGEPTHTDVSKQAKVRQAARKQKKLAGKLQTPSIRPAKFSKRQRHKIWLPTHTFHAKRAHMTSPTSPLWGFAIPITPTLKAYRTTHRATTLRGAVAWDMSYMSTIGLTGTQSSIELVLKALDFGSENKGNGCWAARGRKWRAGTRVCTDWMFERNSERKRPIAPVTVIWAAKTHATASDDAMEIDRPTEDIKKPSQQKVFLRVHPSAFLQIWNELLEARKEQQPNVAVEDLRYEIGSVEVAGPNSTEALVDILRPISNRPGLRDESKLAALWASLKPIENLKTLPSNVVIAFSACDPRLRSANSATTPIAENTSDDIIPTLCEWPLDNALTTPLIFDRKIRSQASTSLPSQKAVNRRRHLAAAGPGLVPLDKDPAIPILAYITHSVADGSPRWHVLLPWKCVLPVWYSLMHCSLSCGGNVRFGGLNEMRQLHYESDVPWFPGDFPGTKAGDQLLLTESTARKSRWEGHPKGKRVEYDSIKISNGAKGEIGNGWACDFSWFLKNHGSETAIDGDASNSRLYCLTALSRPQDLPRRADAGAKSSELALATVRLTMVTRGAPLTCARIYRLPLRDTQLREKWLALQASYVSTKKQALRPITKVNSKGQSTAIIERHWLAEFLVKPAPRIGDADFPPCPGEEDLVGFVTTGNFNLAQGRGTAIGSVVMERVFGLDGAAEEGREEHEKRGKGWNLCVIRDAGQVVGRLARWEFAV